MDGGEEVTGELAYSVADVFSQGVVGIELSDDG